MESAVDLNIMYIAVCHLVQMIGLQKDIPLELSIFDYMHLDFISVNEKYVSFFCRVLNFLIFLKHQPSEILF